MTTPTAPNWTTLVSDRVSACNMSKYSQDNSVSLMAYNIRCDNLVEINMDLDTARALISRLQSAVDYAEDCESMYSDGTPESQRRRAIARKAWERHPANQTPTVENYE